MSAAACDYLKRIWRCAPASFETQRRLALARVGCLTVSREEPRCSTSPNRCNSGVQAASRYL
jgi:hypothetical protein